MPTSPQVPTIGRVVIYTPDPSDALLVMNSDSELPAIIVRTGTTDEEKTKSVVNLQVLANAEHNQWRVDVPYDENGKLGTWKWPARV
jgi:hypothetical protein